MAANKKKINEFTTPDPVGFLARKAKHVSQELTTNASKTHHASHYRAGLPPKEDKRFKKNFLSKHLRGVTETNDVEDENMISERKHRSSHYHVGLPPKEDKRYRKNFLSKHLRGVTEDVQDTVTTRVAGIPVHSVTRTRAKVSGVSGAIKKHPGAAVALGGSLGAAAGGALGGIPGSMTGAIAGASLAKLMSGDEVDTSKTPIVENKKHHKSHNVALGVGGAVAGATAAIGAGKYYKTLKTLDRPTKQLRRTLGTLRKHMRTEGVSGVVNGVGKVGNWVVNNPKKAFGGIVAGHALVGGTAGSAAAGKGKRVKGAAWGALGGATLGAGYTAIGSAGYYAGRKHRKEELELSERQLPPDRDEGGEGTGHKVGRWVANNPLKTSVAAGAAIGGATSKSVVKGALTGGALGAAAHYAPIATAAGLGVGMLAKYQKARNAAKAAAAYRTASRQAATGAKGLYRGAPKNVAQYDSTGQVSGYKTKRGSIYGPSGEKLHDETQYGDNMINENLENALIQISLDGDLNSARDLIQQELGEKVLEAMENKKAAIARAIFSLDNTEE